MAELAQTLEKAASKNHEYQQQLDRFNRLTGKNYVLTDFWGLSDSVAALEFAQIALCRVKRFVFVHDEEYLEIIRFLLQGRGTDLELYYWTEFLTTHLPHPAPSDLIFRGDREPEEILEALKNYRTLPLDSDPS
ncbi:hypothetical protein GCM10008938_41120 [Deinococcus roseus]|uniref:Uncharacterized protein n=2 Tax=Deinococcus roseus TaxID=392414 RepID=A0ABQ2DCH1_9DEIO|nr:hypothetical protein GCM10008938_41120 [Deinococcus roseus]